MNKLIAVTIGDINGIGIDILLNLILNNKLKNIVLFSNIQIIKKYLNKKNIRIRLNQVNNSSNLISFKNKHLNIYSYNCNSNEDNTMKSIEFSYHECKSKNFMGVITLPLRKDLIINKINKKFIGHTEYFQKLDNKEYSNMILFHKKVIISTITTHIKLSSVIKNLKKKNFLFNQILNLNRTLRRDFNIKNPKILLSGLNPHAGENGKIGTEERDIIIPTVNKINKNNILLFGPNSADSMLVNENFKKYDCFVFIYHDQALIPFKYISQFSGVNYTGNLDIIRTSPDHGTAYNLKGSKYISNKSFINCFNLIKKINLNQIKYDKIKKVSRPKFSY